MVLNRPPTDEEVDAEVEKERKRLEEEKRKGPADYGRAIEEVRSHVGDLESSFSSLREHVTASTKRVEDMLKEALEKWGPKEGNAVHGNIEPSSSTKVVATSGMTSHSQEVRQVVQKDFLMPMLQAVDPSIEVAPSIAVGDINKDDVVTSDVAQDKEPVNVDIIDNAAMRSETPSQLVEELPGAVAEGASNVAEGVPVASNQVRHS